MLPVNDGNSLLLTHSIGRVEGSCKTPHNMCIAMCTYSHQVWQSCIYILTVDNNGSHQCYAIILMRRRGQHYQGRGRDTHLPSGTGNMYLIYKYYYLPLVLPSLLLKLLFKLLLLLLTSILLLSAEYAPNNLDLEIPSVRGRFPHFVYIIHIPHHSHGSSHSVKYGQQNPSFLPMGHLRGAPSRIGAGPVQTEAPSRPLHNEMVAVPIKTGAENLPVILVSVTYRNGPTMRPCEVRLDVTVLRNYQPIKSEREPT